MVTAGTKKPLISYNAEAKTCEIASTGRAAIAGERGTHNGFFNI
jgi:hypothetical protein